MGEEDYTVLAVFGLLACLNRDLANKTNPAVGYLWDLTADQEHLTVYKAGMFL